jgi:hypothetical protein
MANDAYDNAQTDREILERLQHAQQGDRPDDLFLYIAGSRAKLRVLEDAWNEKNSELARLADAVKREGQRLIALETKDRALHPERYPHPYGCACENCAGFSFTK